MEKIMEREGKQQQQQQQEQRASVPAFGEWDEMKAAGVHPDYSLDFSKMRAVRMQRKELPSVWSSAGSIQEVLADDPARHTTTAGGHARHHHHRRQHSDHTDLRRPLRRDHAAPPKVRSKVKDYLFSCMGGRR